MDSDAPSKLDREDETETPGLIGVRGFADGGRVERTGIALVHQGEYVVPAPGSEAVISAGEGPRGGAVINYYFPVEVQIVGTPTAEQLRQIADYIYDDLLTALGTV